MDYIKHLSKDKKLVEIIRHREPFELKKQKNVYLHLCASIISQQLSTKVARVIYDRFLKLFDKEPAPQQVLDTSLVKLRSIGLSNAKASYVHNISPRSKE